MAPRSRHAIHRLTVRAVLGIGLLGLFLGPLAETADAQFRGRNRLLVEDTNIAAEQDLVLVPAKNQFGLFWVEEDGKLLFLRIKRNGRSKGKVRTLVEEAESVSAVWTGKWYLVAYVQKLDNAWYAFVIRVSKQGKVRGKPSRPQPRSEVLVTHDPRLAWNGKTVGLLYDEDFTRKDGLYFQLLNKKGKPLDDPVFVGEFDQVRPQLQAMPTETPARTRAEPGFVALFHNYEYERGEYVGEVLAQKITPDGTLDGDPQPVREDDPDGETQALASLETPEGTAVAYSHYTGGGEFQLFDDSLQQVFGPTSFSEQDPFFGDRRRVDTVQLTYRDTPTARGQDDEPGEIWIFYTVFNDTVKGLKVNMDGEIIEGPTLMFELEEVGKYEVLAVATIGKNTVLVYISDDYENSGFAQAYGNLYSRKMRK